MYRRIIGLFIFILSIVFISLDINFNNKNEIEYINIEIKGAVEQEDVISIKYGSTINDLLKVIQLKNDADLSKISLLEVLHNNQIIVIPTKGSNKLISINNASVDELVLLPGIGPSLANRIIEYRNKYGFFISLEDIKSVNGIGDKKYAEIKEYISL